MSFVSCVHSRKILSGYSLRLGRFILVQVQCYGIHELAEVKLVMCTKVWNRYSLQIPCVEIKDYHQSNMIMKF
ncbi:unnamed protein product [Prunus brigantina]